MRRAGRRPVHRDATPPDLRPAAAQVAAGRAFSGPGSRRGAAALR